MNLFRLLNIFWKKEKVYWLKTVKLKEKTSTGMMLTVAFFMIIPHYAVAIMHFLFELFLLVFNKSVFLSNMQKLEASLT